MLQPEVPDLRAPAQVESVQGQHGGDVADSDVRHMDAAVQRQLLQVVQVARDVLQGSVGHPEGKERRKRGRVFFLSLDLLFLFL